MSDAPAYPADACNENGPYPQDVAIRWQSYQSSANPPDGGGSIPETVTITMEGLHLDIAVTGTTGATPYLADPGDGTPTPLVIEHVDGVGGVGHYYAAAGTYHVRVARTDRTLIHEQDVTAVG